MKKLNRFGLQTIALITMTIDHIGKMLIPMKSPLFDIFFYIGRIAMPLFALMIAEGYMHTRNIKKYLGRLLFFGLVIEIFYFSFACLTGNTMKVALNIFLTFFMGLLMLTLLKDKRWYVKLSAIIPLGLMFLTDVVLRDVDIFGVRYWINFEYSFYAIFLILWFGFFKNSWLRASGVLVATLLFCQTLIVDYHGLFAVLNLENIYLIGKWQQWAVLAIPFILIYNGQKGKIAYPKYFFYFYYPLHMVLLYGIYVLINLL